MGEAPDRKTSIQVDTWVWGNEKIIWGYHPDHRYTFKVLEPKKGRAGCMSLQYHHEKSETWLIRRGAIWALFAIDGQVCTRIMRPGDIQNISPGTIHRLAGLSDDAQVIEPSTPDKHAADKAVKKDVVRLHCVFGRDCEAPRTPQEKKIVELCIQYTDEALKVIDAGKMPPEHKQEFLIGRGAFQIT